MADPSECDREIQRADPKPDMDFMVSPDRLPQGLLVSAEVIAHHPWGIAVRLLPPAPDTPGIVDVMYVTNERPFEPFSDYPPLGSRVRAVVMTYAANGQLRLSTRDSDLDRAIEATHRPEK